MNPRILGAFIVGSGLIGLSYFAAATTDQSAAPNVATGVVAGEAPGRSYIEIADTDNNGIPDWRENLKSLRTIPFSTQASSTDDYVIPDTLTAQFAIELFQDTVRKDAYAPFGSTPEDIMAKAEQKIQAAAADKLYTRQDIKISSDNSAASLKNYGNKVAEIAQINGIASDIENEAVITEKAVRQGDPELLAPLATIANSYKNMRDSMLDLPVPQEAVSSHLNLINTYNALLIDIEGMQVAFEDPLYAMTRIKRYEDDATGLYNALNNLYGQLREGGVRYDQTDIAPSVFYFLQIS